MLSIGNKPLTSFMGGYEMIWVGNKRILPDKFWIVKNNIVNIPNLQQAQL